MSARDRGLADPQPDIPTQPALKIATLLIMGLLGLWLISLNIAPAAIAGLAVWAIGVKLVQ